MSGDPHGAAPACGRWSRALWLAALLLLCFWRVGSTPLNETDEGFAANRAASFFRHGTFLVSFDDVESDAPQFRKPPLLYWAVAAGLKTIGWNLWAVRLPVALAGFLCCLLLHRLFRDALGDAAARLAALGFALVPFVLWHIRTAMLEMPLFCLLLLSLHLLLQHSHRRLAPVAAGLVAGSAVLLKGGAGLLAAGALLLCGPVFIRPWRRGLRLALVAAACSALPLALYLAALTPEWRDGFLHGSAIREGSARISRIPLGRRLGEVWGPMWLSLQGHLVAAGPGLLVLLAGLRREVAGRRWLWLALVICVPVFLVGAKQVVPYPRYFLPIYAFVTALSAHFCWWLAQRACGRVPERTRGLLAVALFAIAAGQTYRSGARAGMWIHPNEVPMPEVAHLAARANALLPPGEKLVAGRGFKCHSLLFYSRRGIEIFDPWLARALPDDPPRIALFHGRPYEGVPGIAAEQLARDGDWYLVRLRPAAGAEAIRGVLLMDEAARPGAAAALDLLQAGHRAFASGIVVTSVVARAEHRLPPGDVVPAMPGPDPACVTLVPEPGVAWRLARPCLLSGVDLLPLKRQEVVAEFRVEVQRRGEAAWQPVAAVDAQPALNWTRTAGRILPADERAVRLRFDPVPADAVRIVATGRSRSRLAGITVWSAGEAPNPQP